MREVLILRDTVNFSKRCWHLDEWQFFLLSDILSSSHSVERVPLYSKDEEMKGDLSCQ